MADPLNAPFSRVYRRSFARYRSAQTRVSLAACSHPLVAFCQYKRPDIRLAFYISGP